MAVFKSVLLLLLMSHYVPVSCQDPNPCQRIKNGKVRHPTSCNKYYDCANHRAKQKTCKRTKHYSTKARGCVPIHQSNCVITTTTVPTTQACTPNEESLKLLNKFEHFGKTYYISKETYTSDIASAAVCESLCGYLAEVDDKSEEEIIHKMILDNNAKGALVGGTDKHKDRVWEFDRSRGKLQYINWCPGQPNNYGGIREQCVSYTYLETCMHDAPCEPGASGSRYICESD
ncbi:unnamed protein product [Lymnaea stagnalis]|uniref:C-type lectin domain-containing protein n=1 Tax=Lymnaea stagnalis TaxID=6523 RepID=A0AAV2HQX9_LYMST